MKKNILIAAMAVALMLPTMAWSQTTSPPGSNSGPPGNNMMMQHNPGGQPEGMHENFQERKADILKHMNEHLAEIQKRMACVQAAGDHQALRACMPERREGEMHGEGMERGGPQNGGGQGGER